jgi:cytoskeleton protein RodZ
MAPGPSVPPEPRERRTRPWAVALLIALAAAVALIAYHAAASPPARSAAAGTHKSVTTHHAAHRHKSATSAAHRGAHVVFTVTAVTEPCWVYLTTPGGATIFEGIIGQGTSRTWTERQAVSLRLGNPGAVTLAIDGKPRLGLGSDPVTLNLAPGKAASG